MHVMEITAEQYERIQDCLPVQRGNVRHDNLVLLNTILYVTEHGCKWRGLPKRFGNWHSIYVRMNRWAKKGVLDQVFAKLQEEQILHLKSRPTVAARPGTSAGGGSAGDGSCV